LNITGFPSLDENQERLPNDAALDIERAARADSVRNAIAITMMEGGQPSAFCRELLALYEAGDISGAEMRERMLRKARGGPGQTRTSFPVRTSSGTSSGS
jgi:hypothetical protein